MFAAGSARNVRIVRRIIEGLVQGSESNDCMLDKRLLFRSLKDDMIPKIFVQVFSKIGCSCLTEYSEIPEFEIVGKGILSNALC